MLWQKKKLVCAVSLATFFTGLTASQIASTASDPLTERMSQRAGTPQSARLEQLKLNSPQNSRTDSRSIIDPQLHRVSGHQTVIVRLRQEPVANSSDTSRAGRMARKKQLQRSQEQFLDRVRSIVPRSQVKGRTQMVINSIFMDVDAAQLKQLAQDPDVFRINRVKEYKVHLADTVPYIGATTVQNTGVTGAGVKVAVLDSGIDYHHIALGGSGDPADYAADDPSIVEPDSFPTAKVVAGYDFVGSNWGGSGDPLEPDADPLDDGPEAGHGTHVADIIGGDMGVAPGVDLYAVKVCSSVSTSCSGVALVQGIEYAADPNGDGDPSDRVDIINMSLGSDYGQPFDDDLAAAVDNASALGVFTVASAGNGGNKPYITGTPASAPTALSVAQTQVPSAVQPLLSIGGNSYPGVFQPWSVEPAGVVSGTLQYGDGAGGNLDGCAPFASSLDGLAVLVDRGACSFTLKISNISQAGGELGIIGLIAPGDPFSGGDGGDRPIDIPGYMVSQSISNTFKGLTGQELSVDPADGVPLVGQMVGSSSRGPQHEATGLIKPEIGAPGASVSAIAGSGMDTGPFGGTSGAAPMVSGSAALLLQAEPGMSPAYSKARLMNSGFTGVTTDPNSGLAPITRIGSGEVRVDESFMAPAIAWDRDTEQPSLSFGFLDVDRPVTTLHKSLSIRNTSNQTLRFDVKPTFRDPADEASGAVQVSVSPSSVRLTPGRTANVRVRMRIDGGLLPANAMNSGSDGAAPETLDASEFDGHIVFDDGIQSVHVPWQVLPRKAASVQARQHLNTWRGSDSVRLNNRGEGVAQNDAYALIALSDNQPEGGEGEQAPTPDIRAVGINTFPVPAGFCSGAESFLWTFAINTWERQQHLLPVSHIVYLDTNRDGTDDYAVLNRDFSGLGTISDGRQLTWSIDLATGAANAFFFAEHATNTGNTVLTVCAEQLGMSAADLLSTKVNMAVEAQDFYYGGPGDIVEGLTVTPYGERFVGSAEDLPAGARGTLEVQDFGPFPGNTPEYGVMLFTNGDRGAGNHGGATPDTEALLFRTR